MEGKAVFVSLTLPGEQVRVRVTQSKRGYDTAEPDVIVAASSDRVTPGCPHFGLCGGCNYQHANYETQLDFKQTILRETLERGGVTAPDAIEVLAAGPWKYRNRIRLAVDAAGNIGYRGRRSNAVIPIRECPIAAPLLINSAKAIAQRASRSLAFASQRFRFSATPMNPRFSRAFSLQAPLIRTPHEPKSVSVISVPQSMSLPRRFMRKSRSSKEQSGKSRDSQHGRRALTLSGASLLKLSRCRVRLSRG